MEKEAFDNSRYNVAPDSLSIKDKIVLKFFDENFDKGLLWLCKTLNSSPRDIIEILLNLYTPSFVDYYLMYNTTPKPINCVANEAPKNTDNEVPENDKATENTDNEKTKSSTTFSYIPPNDFKWLKSAIDDVLSFLESNIKF